MKRKLIVTYLIVVVVVAILISAVVFVLLWDGETIPESEGPYPVLTPNEKLPNISVGWGYGGPKPVFKFDGPFPKMPSRMVVYKIVRPQNITDDYVRDLAEKYFGMPRYTELTRSSPRPGGSALYWLKTQTHLFEFDHDTGFFNILKYEKARMKRSRDRKDFPTDEECKRIALEYLKERDLLPEDAHAPGISDNTSSGVMSVGFGKVIDGYRSWGPGSQILVDMGPGGEIVKVMKNWAELVPWKLAPIKTPKEAFKELEDGKAYMGGHGGKINNITLRYDTPGGLALYAQPVYYFEYTAPERDFYAAVPAIKDKYLKSRKETIKEIEEKENRPGK